MSNAKNIGVVGLALLLAFIFGYKRDLLSNAFKQSDRAVSDTAPDLDTPGKKETERKVKRVQPSHAVTREKGAKKVTPRKVINNTSQPHNPYAAMMKAAAEARKKRGETLSGTMDSIRSGSIGEARKVQRNAYFDKLSQQLKELRGEGPAGKESKEDDQPSAIDETPQRGANRPKTQPAPQGIIIPETDVGTSNSNFDTQIQEATQDELSDDLLDEDEINALGEEMLVDEGFLDDEGFEDAGLLD